MSASLAESGSPTESRACIHGRCTDRASAAVGELSRDSLRATALRQQKQKGA